MNPFAVDFGVSDTLSLWPQTIRILIVIDGRVDESKNPKGFGMGYALETLRAPFSWWVRFQVDVKRHEGPQGAFRFTDAGFDIDAYDQIWFFGDLPNRDDGADGAMTDNDIQEFALSNAELKLVAEWMDRGGGVFAAGDHTLLGASKCSRIPRVRSMRRWKLAQHVPAKDAKSRHETLQPNPGADPETDTLFQPIELVLAPTGSFPFPGAPAPHPLFQSTRGLIDRFPDHMHEGEVIPDDEVLLDQPLDIPGYFGAEYPFPSIVVGSALDDVALPLFRPRPRIVAYGETTIRNFPDEVIARSQLSVRDLGGVNTVPFTKRFGLVGVYDGDAIGIGRVIVDSTWHHWFSMNLHATIVGSELVVTQKLGLVDIDHVPTHLFNQRQYERMQAFYRNVGLWLATPAQRRAMLIAGVWGVLVNAPPFEFGNPANLLQIGERTLKLLEATAPPGMLAELANAFVDRRVLAPSETGPAGAWPGVQAEQVNRAIVGGIGSALLKRAMEFREQRSRGQRPRIDPAKIRAQAIEGASRGNALLKRFIEETAASIGAMLANLRASAPDSLIDVSVPIETQRLRFVATRLQLPDPRDPALVDGSLAATVRIKLGNDVVASWILERAELQSFGVHGAAIDLDHAAEIEVHAWEQLTVEVIAGRWSPRDAIDPEAMRFEHTLVDDPVAWIGEHTPARSQAWRLWYQIEESETVCDMASVTE
jgi:hypothetical protein